MDTCQGCSSKTVLTFCEKRKLFLCEKCERIKNSSSTEIKCSMHHMEGNGYCCICNSLTCIACAEHHEEHGLIPVTNAYKSITSEDTFTNGLQVEESKLKCYQRHCENLVKLIEEEEKRFLDIVSRVKIDMCNKLLDKDTKKKCTDLIEKLNGVQNQLEILQAEKRPLIFLSKWPFILAWLNEYREAEQELVDGPRKQFNASYISQMFMDLILKYDGSSVDKPTAGSFVDKPTDGSSVDNPPEDLSVDKPSETEIDKLAAKMAVVSLNEKSDPIQCENEGNAVNAFVVVERDDCKSEFENKKDEEHDRLEKRCNELIRETEDLKKKLEQFEKLENKHTCPEKATNGKEIEDLKKELQNLKQKHYCLEKTRQEQKTRIDELLKIQTQCGKLKDEHTRLEKTCSDQKQDIADLKKILKNCQQEHSSLSKTNNQQSKQIDEMKKNLESQRLESEKIVNIISAIVQWLPEISKHKDRHEGVSIKETSNDTPNVKDCKRKVQPILNTIVDYANVIIIKDKELRIREERIKELASENGKLRQQTYDLQKQYDEQIQCLNKLKLDAQKSIASLKNTVETFKTQCMEKEKTIQILQTEKDDLQTRLSSVAGDKLAKGNPAITDLSDPNRPMKISEKYGELYDNEWTDAIECTDTIKTLYPDTERQDLEEIIIRHLFKLLKLCYKDCVDLSKKQLRTIGETVVQELSLQEDEKSASDIPGLGDVCKFRRHHSETFADYLVKNKVLARKMDVADWVYEYKNADLMQKLAGTPFFEKCVHLCWYMAIQEPIMHLSDEPMFDAKYDKNVYKEFVKSGDKVKYAVWPALYLHEGGPVLFKGVVQAYS